MRNANAQSLEDALVAVSTIAQRIIELEDMWTAAKMGETVLKVGGHSIAVSKDDALDAIVKARLRARDGLAFEINNLASAAGLRMVAEVRDAA